MRAKTTKNTKQRGKRGAAAKLVAEFMRDNAAGEGTDVSPYTAAPREATLMAGGIWYSIVDGKAVAFTGLSMVEPVEGGGRLYLKAHLAYLRQVIERGERWLHVEAQQRTARGNWLVKREGE